MAKRKIIWTQTAAKQRREILSYWTERNKSKTYAETLIEITAKHLKVICKNPEALRKLIFMRCANQQWVISVCFIRLHPIK
jgi:hypothetical protein